MRAMDERAEPEQPSPPDAPGPGGPVEGGEGGQLVSPELAALYIQQGEYERGIAMYRSLLARDPDNPALKDRLDDAEALADLLILRKGGHGGYQKGYREGYSRALADRSGVSREERIARLSAWLERVKGRA
jgi:tetratricopeptide (TPR) repeat protein